jgi:hypothetical protein
MKLAKRKSHHVNYTRTRSGAIMKLAKRKTPIT